MFLLTRRLGLVLGLAVSLGSLGCESGFARDTVEAGPPAPPETASLSFDDPGTLKLAWGATQPLYFTAKPPMQYRVGFSLLGNFESGFDGSLDDAMVFTGEDGHGLVTLHAPSQSTTFSIRASILDAQGVPGASAERSVAVSEKGFGSVQVTPMYSGHRPVTEWDASVVGQTTCADLKSQGLIPGDPPGGITASAPAGTDPIVATAPVGSNLAVLVRAGHFAGGCADVTMLTAGDTLDVPVTVLDVPLDLADADLTATFDYTPDPAAYATVLSHAVTTLVDAFMPQSSSEGTILLNGMAAATPVADAATFAALRVEQSWDYLADQHFAALGTSLRDTCGAWAGAGAAAQPTSFQATLLGGPGGHLTILVTQYGGLDPQAAGVSVVPGATWSGLPDDSVLLSGSLLWEPSRFAGVSSLGPAQQAHAGAATVASALALEADCHGLAEKLGAFNACTVDCVEKLCEAAIAARWTTALAASKKSSAFGHLLIQGSGDTTVGDIAQPVSIDGHWQGEVGDATVQVPIKGGAVKASASQQTP